MEQVKEVSDDSSACTRCGREALGVLGEEALCESCYHSASACCGVFGEEEPQ